MISVERVRSQLGAVVRGPGSAQTVADRLCRACVELLEVDGASLSIVLNGESRGTFGASGAWSRLLDELQLTVGEGPCLDAVEFGAPVLVADLDDPAETRWPAFSGAVLEAGVAAVFALPVSLATSRVGALDLFRRRRGRLNDQALAGGLLAAELAALPLLDLLAAHNSRVTAEELALSEAQPAVEGGLEDPDADGWTRLASLDRVEVYQATGMIMGALGVDPGEALVRLRAHAYARGLSAAHLAGLIVQRRVPLDSPDWQDPPAPAGPGR